MPVLREQEAAQRAVELGLNAPSYQQAPDRLLVGLSQRYTMETRGGIPQLWDRFMTRLAQMPHANCQVFYGVSWNTTKDGCFDYLAGIEATSPANTPTDFTTLPIPARRNAVFPHTLHVSAIPAVLDAIWSKWVPNCGLKFDCNAPMFEQYTAEFNPQTGFGGIEFWIPLAE